MAETPITFVNLPALIVASAGRTYYRSDPVKDLSGATVDLTTWSNFLFMVFSPTPNSGYPATPIITSSIAAVGNSDGTLNILLDATNLPLLNNGAQYTVGVYAQASGPGPSELLAVGSLNVKQA